MSGRALVEWLDGHVGVGLMAALLSGRDVGDVVWDPVNEFCVVLGKGLPTPQDPVTIDGINLNEVAAPSGLVGCNQC